MKLRKPDITTREFCDRCQSVNAVGFFSPLWEEVAGRWSGDILCLRCFALLGDEKSIAWEVGIEFYPVSYATLHAGRAKDSWHNFFLRVETGAELRRRETDGWGDSMKILFDTIPHSGNDL